MFFVKRRGVARLAAAVLASGLAAAGAIATAGPAVAEDAPSAEGGATATLSGLKTFDQAIIHDNGQDDAQGDSQGSQGAQEGQGQEGEESREQRVGAGLFEMAVDNGGTLQTYSIDIHHPTQQQDRYREVAWSSSSLHDNRNAGKIRWILQNSYPQVNDLAALGRKSGVGNLTEQTAAAGTQVAIWRYSDGADVEAVDPAAEKLADYLQKSAKNLAEPQASLKLAPAAVAGKSGGRIGPVTVHTNADSVTVTPASDVPGGVEIVGKDGEPLTQAANGTELYFDVPADADDGTTSLTAAATTKVPVGRVFTGTGEHASTQTQILAGSSESTVASAATASWSVAGPIPAVTAEGNCAKGGVDVTTSDNGDAPFRFRLAGREHELAPGTSETVTVPVAEDQSYEIEVTGEGGFTKTFSGVMDCETAGNAPAGPRPHSVGGTGVSAPGEPTPGDLAETGSNSTTPVIAGIAITLIVAGTAAVLALRKKPKN